MTKGIQFNMYLNPDIITKDEAGNVDQVCIDLDPDKVMRALMSGQNVLGKPMSYWASYITERAQELSDEATPKQYDDWGVEALGYDF